MQRLHLQWLRRRQKDTHHFGEQNCERMLQNRWRVCPRPSRRDLHLRSIGDPTIARNSCLGQLKRLKD
ncbi:hypothetical protein RSSM_02685 [Rhodopirellula sallentina SM41]|uniref:Uncharacterized protein n=1 Tax=Rhodopirellula sallentina SM41 TaxID=1263870 RepID=M5UIJ9_9BACT|nr:hypothetical protein RSSM_02685 [Rhodopirellula sallentina SM41]